VLYPSVVQRKTCNSPEKRSAMSAGSSLELSCRNSSMGEEHTPQHGQSSVRGTKGVPPSFEAVTSPERKRTCGIQTGRWNWLRTSMSSSADLAMTVRRESAFGVTKL
jgi:hypothetical protein